MVVYQKPEKVDPLAVKLAHLEGIPLVVTDLDVEGIVARMNELKEERCRWKQE